MESMKIKKYFENDKIRMSKIKDMFDKIQEENEQLMKENEKLKEKKKELILLTWLRQQILKRKLICLNNCLH